MKKIMLFLFWSLLLQTGWTQTLLDTRINFSVETLRIPEAINQLVEESGVSISFSNNFFSTKKTISLTLEQASVATILQKILTDTGVEYLLLGQQVVLRRAKVLKKYTISGYIQNAEDGEKLIAATIFSPKHQQGTISNEYGFFSLTLPAGPTGLTCSYLGSQEKKLEIDLDKNMPLQVELQRSITLGEIVVKPSEESGQQLFSTSPNANEVAIKQLKRIPDLGGEPDLLRAAQLLPGVQSGADGLGGLNVRGGNADQNLMLLDGVPVYNPSHLLGIFSIFNTSAIREAKLIKGNFPARYGGRLSSILDVRSREGNDRKWSGELQTGLISAKATVEGPIAGKKGAVLLTGRRTHSTFLLDEVTREAFFPNYSGPLQYNFYDVNAKVNFSLSPNDRIYFGFYQGGDLFRTTEEFSTQAADGSPELEIYDNSLTWGNLIGSFRWNHQFGNRLFANTTLTYSQYDYRNELLTEFFEEDIDGELVGDIYEFYSNGADIRDFTAKVDFDFVASPRHYWRFGLGGTQHYLAPGVGFFEGEETEFLENDDDLTLDDLENFFEFDITQTQEWHAYVEDEFRLKNKWMLNLGLRLSGFLHPDAAYFRPQPRLGIRYSINDRWSAHGGFSRMVQYLHRLAGIGISKPDDVWVPSTDIIKPQEAWQSGLSLHYSTPQKLDISIESYLKVMDNLVRFDDTTFFLDPEEPIEENLVFGSGIAYGVELLVKKDFGKTGGHFAYTLANSQRQFPALNLGNDFPFLFDRRHQVSLFVFHRFSKRWEASAAFLYGSSHPTVALEEDLNFGLKTIPINPEGDKNQKRNEGYHRLDITFLYQFPAPRSHHTFKAGLYNVYNQNNDAFQRYQFDDGQLDLESVSFMPILPSFSYLLKF